MAGLISYGTYVPYFRLDKKTIATAMGAGGGKGTRAVASYDEDTTSMGVEAARNALAALPGAKAHALVFSTTDPAYLDKTNATAIHAALDLSQEAFAVDAMGSVRSGVGALMLGASCGRPTLVVLSDRRTGQPTSGDEANGGDAAVALLFGTDGVVAELVAQASSTAEFLDRWRAPGSSSSQLWEERFGETVYVPLAQAAITDACKQSGITAETIDHLVVTGPHTRSVGVIATPTPMPTTPQTPNTATSSTTTKDGLTQQKLSATVSCGKRSLWLGVEVMTGRFGFARESRRPHQRLGQPRSFKTGASSGRERLRRVNSIDGLQTSPARRQSRFG